MCLIVDLNRVIEVFGNVRQPCADEMLDWMNSKKCRVVVGGKLKRELLGHGPFALWAQTAMLDGRLRQEDDTLVDGQEANVKATGLCISDDPHIVALAQICGSRVLYSEDRDLRDDFRDGRLVSPAGKLLPMGDSSNDVKARRRMLNLRLLCDRYHGRG